MTPSHLIELENEFPASDTKSKTRNVCIDKRQHVNFMLDTISEGHPVDLIEDTLRVGLFFSSTRNSFSKFN